MEQIIDCHVHIYPEKIAEKASVNIGVFYDMGMRYDGRINVVKEKCKEHGISKCLVNSVATVPEQVTRINDFIKQSVDESDGMFTGFATLHQALSVHEIETELNRVEKLGLVGIKLHPDFQKFSIDDKSVYKIYEAAEGRFPVLFHTGDFRFNYSNPARLAKVLSDFPRLVAIGAHFGGWSEWDDGIKQLAGKENIYVDTSSSFYSMTPEKALETIHAFGADKVLFGTDYPMWDVGDELEFFNKLSLTDKERGMILSENAVKLFGL